MIVQISGPDDPALAAFRRVGDHEWLRASGLFVAEGRLVTERLLRTDAYRVESVLVTPPALRALDAALGGVDAPVFVAPPSILAAVTGFNFHRGCLALAARPEPGSVDDFACARLLVGLEAVGNPDNVGGLFRTAAAFGADGVLVDRRTGDPFYRKALRTSMGAVLDMPFGLVDAWPAALPRLRGDRRVVALTPDPSAMTLAEFVREGHHERLLLIVGSEGAGLTREALDAADHRVRIPVVRGVDSLNVTVAAGIALARMTEPAP